MKRTILFSIILLLGISLSAQNLKTEQVPLKARQRCMVLFPQTQNAVKHPVTWVKNNDGRFKGTLTIMEAPAYILVDSTGMSFTAEYCVQSEILPKRVKEYFQRHYPGYEMLQVYRITNDKKSDNYRVKAKVVSQYLFDEDGLFISEPSKN